jgi:hypothetical protein
MKTKLLMELSTILSAPTKRFRLVVLLAGLIAAPHALGADACNIKDVNGKAIRSADCFGALLRVEVDKFIYARFDDGYPNEGFQKSTQQNSHTLVMYFRTPGCSDSNNIYLYSPARSLGYFFEPVQYVDDLYFYYPEWNALSVGGTAIVSYWDGYECVDSTGWWSDEVIFAPLMSQLISVYKLTPPFAMTR